MRRFGDNLCKSVFNIESNLFHSHIFPHQTALFKKNCIFSKYLSLSNSVSCGPGSSVGIATNYGLDGPGSNPGGDEIFCPSRPALGPTQSPVQWILGLSRGLTVAGA